MLEFDSGNSFRMKEDVSLVASEGNRRGKRGSTVEVVMVIMTSDGTPTGVSCRLGTREIIFCAELSSTGIVNACTLLQVPSSAISVEPG